MICCLSEQGLNPSPPHASLTRLGGGYGRLFIFANLFARNNAEGHATFVVVS